jgi:hypothetical protein
VPCAIAKTFFCFSIAFETEKHDSKSQDRNLFSRFGNGTGCGTCVAGATDHGAGVRSGPGSDEDGKQGVHFQRRRGTYGRESGSDRSYNELYAAIKGMGKYEVVAAPANADLVLEISFVNSGAQRGSYFRLVVLDPQTRVSLWVHTEYMQGAVWQKTGARTLIWRCLRL